jgi:hypothetical protein
VSTATLRFPDYPHLDQSADSHTVSTCCPGGNLVIEGRCTFCGERASGVEVYPEEAEPFDFDAVTLPMLATLRASQPDESGNTPSTDERCPDCGAEYDPYSGPCWCGMGV